MELELVIVVLLAVPTNPPAIETPFCALLIVTLPLLVLFTTEVPCDVWPIRPPKPMSPPVVSDEYDDISVLELTSVISVLTALPIIEPELAPPTTRPPTIAKSLIVASSVTPNRPW